MWQCLSICLKVLGDFGEVEILLLTRTRPNNLGSKSPSTSIQSKKQRARAVISAVLSRARLAAIFISEVYQVLSPVFPFGSLPDPRLLPQDFETVIARHFRHQSQVSLQFAAPLPHLKGENTVSLQLLISHQSLSFQKIICPCIGQLFK